MQYDHVMRVVGHVLDVEDTEAIDPSDLDEKMLDKYGIDVVQFGNVLCDLIKLAPIQTSPFGRRVHALGRSIEDGKAWEALAQVEVA